MDKLITGYRIWSTAENAWWRARFQGVTTDEAQAHQYTWGEAMDILKGHISRHTSLIEIVCPDGGRIRAVPAGPE